MDLLTVVTYSGNPFTSYMTMHAFITILCPFRLPVPQVFTIRTNPQILATVIKSIVINVIDHFPWKGAGYPTVKEDYLIIHSSFSVLSNV